MENTTNAAPTGCFKCGRPGHWSRDCPSSSSSSSAPATATATAPSNPNFSSNKSNWKPVIKDKPKKAPRSRPKLTPNLLLSDDGLGFVLRHFPRALKYRGRGHEVKDLGNLIGLYSEWHSHLLPYYSFDQFVHKVEQVAASRTVKTCIRALRERVANGGDPTKLYEAPFEYDGPADEQAPAEPMATEGQHQNPRDQSLNVHATDDIHEDLLHEIYREATEEPSQSLQKQSEMVAVDVLPADISRKILPDEVPNNGGSSSNEVQITEEQRARMEANRQKALERAAARERTLQAS